MLDLGAQFRRSEIRLTNLRLALGPGARFELEFDISWAGSWRFEDGLRDNNWDAAWVFVKYDLTPTVTATDEELNLIEAGGPGAIRRFFRGKGLPLGRTFEVRRTEDCWRVESQLCVEPNRPGAERECEEVCYVVRPAGAETQEILVRGWQPARVLEVTATPEGAVVVPSDNRCGVLIHRGPDNAGYGKVSFDDVGVSFELPVASGDGVDLDVAVFPIRMVYIPEGQFWAGDLHRNVDSAFYDSCTPDSEENLAFLVDSEDAIEVGDGSTCEECDKQLFYQSSPPLFTGGDRKGPIPAEFPKGYRGFYVMRSHVSQGQYAEFINFLPSTSRTQRYPYEEGAYRYTIARDRSMNRIARRPARACNFLSWADGIAFTAWAGLRPMTELEFEKACRGSALPVTQEYAWGNTRIVLAQVIVGPGTTEVAVSGNCNTDNAFVLFNGGDDSSGPVRDDAFSLAGSPDVAEQFESGYVDLREATGASFYGVLGMSGNLWEMAVTVGLPQGRAFTGENGTGELLADGSAPAGLLGWPGDNARGAGFRGGAWFTPAARSRLADRMYAAGLEGYFFRSLDTGFRCATFAPEGDG